MVATRGRTFKRPWRRSCHSSKLKSSSAPIGRKDSWCFHAVGSSNAPLLGSTAAEGFQRIGRTSTATRWRSCGLPQSASCSENFVIPPDVFGQTLRVQDGSKRPAVYAARHIGGYADIIITRLYEKRSRAAGLSLDLVDNREVVVHLGRAKIQPRGRLVGCLIGSLYLGSAQFRRLGLQYRHGLRDFWVRLRVPRIRHERGRCDEANSGQETNKKALAIHVNGLLYERRSWNEGSARLRRVHWSKEASGLGCGVP